MKNNESINLKNQLQSDNVFVKSELISLSSLTGLATRKGLEKAIISENQIVNVVSNAYGHLPNEKFFYEVEAKLIDAGLTFINRSINRVNRSFAVDYILSDDNWVVAVKNSNDKLRPMLRFTNSYDGSCKTSGHFGFYREVCTNGLHIAQSTFCFSVKHKGDIAQVIIPEIKMLVDKFMNNEFYSLHSKFEVLAERPIKDLEDFVKVTAELQEEFSILSEYQAQDPIYVPSLETEFYNQNPFEPSTLAERIFINNFLSYIEAHSPGYPQQLLGHSWNDVVENIIKKGQDQATSILKFLRKLADIVVKNHLRKFNK